MVAKADKSLKAIVKNRMDELGISILELSRQTGIPSGRIYKWYKNDTNPKYEDVQTLQEWLNSKSVLDIVPRESLGPTYMEQRRWDKINDDSIPSVPFITVKARAGYSRNYENSDFLKEEFQQYQIPPGVPWRGAEWRWFEVGGDSMSPLLEEKDVLLCSRIPEADWLDMEEFKIYVVVYKDTVVVKRIWPDGNDFILISENEKEYPQKRIPITDVKEIWKLRRQLNARFPPTKEFIITV